MRWKVIKKQNKTTSLEVVKIKLIPILWMRLRKHNGKFSHWAQKLLDLSPICGGCYLCTYYLCPPAQRVVSGTGALILTAVNLSGERNLPQCSRAQAAQVLGGRFSIQLFWIRWLYRGSKEVIGLLGRTQERGEAELLLLDLVTFVTTPPLIKELDTFCLPTRHFGGFNSPWATIFSLGGHRAML